MRIFLLSLVLVIALSSTCADNEPVVDAYDFDALFANPEHWKDAFQCFLGQKECGDLQQLKDGVMRRLLSNCGECNPEQRKKFDHVLEALSQTYPDDFVVVQNIVKKE